MVLIYEQFECFMSYINIFTRVQSYALYDLNACRPRDEELT